jgi:hypothetical protein
MVGSLPHSISIKSTQDNNFHLDISHSFLHTQHITFSFDRQMIVHQLHIKPWTLSLNKLVLMLDSYPHKRQGGDESNMPQ